ncbi:MAG: hypothetical protein EA424_02440 [Planctomycetaceae bacterium]|nr:MAG: hypothetical protein EA424_02440 [Planctomycetaceae bacterium]
MTENEPDAVDLPDALGVDSGISTQCFSVHVPDAFLANLPRIREFLHRMGRETNQGEIAFEFDGRFYRIRRFDEGK